MNSCGRHGHVRNKCQLSRDRRRCDSQRAITFSPVTWNETCEDVMRKMKTCIWVLASLFYREGKQDPSSKGERNHGSLCYVLLTSTVHKGPPAPALAVSAVVRVCWTCFECSLAFQHAVYSIVHTGDWIDLWLRKSWNHGKENITVRRVWLAEANKWSKSNQNIQSSAALAAGFFRSAKSCYITYSTDVNRSSHPSQQNEEYKDIRGTD